MSRFAPVVPVHMAAELQGVQGQSQDYLGAYHLLLAHDVLDKPKAYEQVYGEVRRRYGKNSFIIMDNSIVELGKAMEIKDLLEACKVLQPDCLVAPDIMGEGDATRHAAVQFVREYAQKGSELEAVGLQVPSLLGVIQGSTIEDALSTYLLYYSMPLLDYISVPRIITKQHGSRMPLLLEMNRVKGMRSAFKGIHLLGFSDNILDDICCARLPFIQGIDSAVPIRAALQGMAMDLRDSEWSSKLGPRGDFWERPIDSTWKTMQPAIEYNLDLYRGWIAPQHLRLAA